MDSAPTKPTTTKPTKPTTTKLTTSLNPFGSHMRESLVCTSPFFHWLLLLRVRVLVSCQSSYNSHRSDYCKSSSPIKLFALAQLSTARKLSCLYPYWHFSSEVFVVVQLLILLHYSDGHCCYSHHTIEWIGTKSLLSLSLQQFGVYVCVGYILIYWRNPHTLSVYLPLRENAFAIWWWYYFNRLECICWSCRVY